MAISIEWDNKGQVDKRKTLDSYISMINPKGTLADRVKQRVDDIKSGVYPYKGASIENIYKKGPEMPKWKKELRMLYEYEDKHFCWEQGKDFMGEGLSWEEQLKLTLLIM